MANSFDELLAADQRGFDQAYKMALGRELRRDAPVTARWGDAISEIGGDIADKMRLRDAEQARLEQVLVTQQKIKAAVATYAPELVPLVEAGDYKSAAAGLKDKIAQQQADAAYERSPFGGVPAQLSGSEANSILRETLGKQARGAVPSFEEVAGYLKHKDPRIAGAAKAYLERYYPNSRKLDELAPDPETGLYTLPAGAVEATGQLAGATAKGKAGWETVEVEMPDPVTGRLVKARMTAEQAADRGRRLYGDQSGATQAPSATPTMGRAPSVAPAPAAQAGGASDLPSQLEVLGNLAAAEKDPVKQQALFAKMEALSGGQGFEMKVPPPGQGAVLTSTFTGRGGAPAPSSIPGAVPVGAAEGQKSEATGAAATQTSFNKLDQEYLRSSQDQLMRLEALDKIAKRAPESMVEDYAGRAWNEAVRPLAKTLRIRTDASQSDTARREFEQEAGALVAESLATYGRQPTDLDLKAAQQQVAQAGDSYEAKKALIDNARARIEQKRRIAEERLGIRRTPTEPGAGAAPAPGPRSSAADARGLPESYWTATAGGAVSDAMPEQSPINIKTAPRHPSMDPNYEAEMLRKENSLASHLGGAASGFWDAQKNVGRGLIQLMPDILKNEWMKDYGGREDTRAERARQATEAEMTPGYEIGRTLGDIVNPTLVLPMSLAAKTARAGAPVAEKAARAAAGYAGSAPVVGGLSGAAVMAETPEERAGNTAAGAILGPAAKKVTDIIAPATRLSGPVAKEYEELARKWGVPVDAVRAGDDTFITAMARGMGMGNERNPEQAAGVTKTWLERAGSDRDRVTPQLMTDIGDRLGREWKDIFGDVNPNRGQRVVRGTVDTLTDFDKVVRSSPGVEELMMKGGAPNLQKVRAAFESAFRLDEHYRAQGVNPREFRAPDITLPELHAAYREVSDVAGGAPNFDAGQVKKVLKKVMLDSFRPLGVPEVEAQRIARETMAEFERTNRQWGAYKDLETVWEHGSGQGRGKARGTISPSDIEQHARDFRKGGTGAEAVNVVSGLGLEDYAHPSMGIGGLAKYTVGKLASPFNQSEIGSSAARRAYIDILRDQAPVFGREWVEGRRTRKPLED